MERLILFDIDETMISSDGAGRRAIGRALCQIFDIDASNVKVSMSGKTDPQILSEIFKLANKTEDELHLKKDEMFRVYLDILKEEIKNAGYYIVHPGVYELLDELALHDKGFLGLLTGNIEPGARLKLERFDLNKYFPLGAYGSDSANRMDLPAIATERASKHYQIDFEPSQVVIVGDSIFDVLCAKGFGARSIAVNTGATTRAALEEQEPDYLFDSLANTREVLDAIFA